MVPPLWKEAWQFLLELNGPLSYDPAVSLLDIYPIEMKHTYTQRFVFDSFVHSNPKQETTKISNNR